jgi:hypothetical protein
MRKIKISVEGAKPITGNKYLNASNTIDPRKILLGASFEGKKECFEASPVPFSKKVCIIKSPDKPIRIIEVNRGRNPPPGDLSDPMGYIRDSSKIPNPRRNKIIPLMRSRFFRLMTNYF